MKKHSELTMKELTEHFTISEIAIRKHIRELIANDFVQEKIQKQEVGRPFHLYSLTKKGHQVFPNQYNELPVELLKDVENLYGESAINKLIERRAKREKQALANEIKENDFDHKIKTMVDYMKERGYLVEYQKTDTGDYEIKNFNCPIYNVVTNYTQVCNYEKQMYEDLFPESEVKVNQCLSRGEKYCYWHFTRPETETNT